MKKDKLNIVQFFTTYILENLPVIVILLLISFRVNIEIRLIIVGYIISRIFISYQKPPELLRFLENFSEPTNGNKKLNIIKYFVYAIELGFLFLSLLGTYRGLNNVLGINELFFPQVDYLSFLNFAFVYSILITCTLFVITYFIIKGKDNHYFVIVFIIVDIACVMPFNYLFFYEKIKQQYQLNIYREGVIDTEEKVSKVLESHINTAINIMNTEESINTFESQIIDNPQNKSDSTKNKNNKKQINLLEKKIDKKDSIYLKKEKYIEAGNNLTKIKYIITKHLKYQADFIVIDTSQIRYVENVRTLLLKTIEICGQPDSLTNKIKTINDNKIDAIIAIKQDIASKMGLSESPTIKVRIPKTSLDVWNNKVSDIRWLSLLFSIVIDLSPLILGVLFAVFKKSITNS
ncbi:hypothetical protein VB776_21840 [Arcicella sp. DC2W]|uniref:Uncharacterized protein n=1 Tax=Arcicella gelida TaxID=2984195 RepID=A0ABU5SAS8_9BACT|nr:hypothetical protein [Arcicella sp. DC2W]MEA5405597.1 hypothetical protein [Arcicella sp. DC2W]